MSELRKLIDDGCRAIAKGDASDAIAVLIWANVERQLAEAQERIEELERERNRAHHHLAAFLAPIERLVVALAPTALGHAVEPLRESLARARRVVDRRILNDARAALAPEKEQERPERCPTCGCPASKRWKLDWYAHAQNYVPPCPDPFHDPPDEGEQR